MAFIVDNSVMIAWLIDRQADAYTRRLSVRADREQLHAPALWPFEFVNAMAVMQRRQLIREHQADAFIIRATRIGVLVDSASLDMAALLNLARGMGVSAYDAAYIDLAQRRGLPLATRDVNLRRAARAAGVTLA